MEDCVFCRVIEKKALADIVYEDERFVVFRDLNPKAPVHVLVVPKKHVESLNEVELQSGLMDEAVEVIQRVTKKLKINSAYQVRINCGKKAGQVVFHLHIHVMGGWNQKQTD